VTLAVGHQRSAFSFRWSSFGTSLADGWLLTADR
jgi:hypothetical protein